MRNIEKQKSMTIKSQREKFKFNTNYGKIYSATNNLNGKIYIGKVEMPKTIRDRWEEHLRDGKKLKRKRNKDSDKKIYSTHLNNAIAKYCSTVWIVKQIGIAINENELNEKERFWIKKYDSMNPNIGYNMTEGGESGKKRPEVRNRISKSVRELWQNEKYKEKQKAGRKEMWKNKDYRESMIKNKVEKWQDPEFSKNQSKKISKAIEKKWQDPEYQKIQSEKISITIKKLWQNPNFKTFMRNSLKEK